MWKQLRGLGVPPAIVGFVRGLVEAAVLAAIAAIILTVQNTDFSIFGISETWGVLVVAASVNGLRFLEGIADGIDPAKKRQ